jgi:dUTPase
MPIFNCMLQMSRFETTPLTLTRPDDSTVRFVRRGVSAQTPVAHSNSSRGIELRSAYNYTVKPGQTVDIHTDLQLQIPEGYFGLLVKDNSELGGTASQLRLESQGITTGERRNIVLQVTNIGEETYFITNYQCIALLVLVRALTHPKVEEIRSLTPSLWEARNALARAGLDNADGPRFHRQRRGRFIHPLQPRTRF